MKVKLNFKNNGFKIRLNDSDADGVDIGNINSESSYYSYTMDGVTADALTSLLSTLKRVISIIDSIPKVGFNLPSSGFDYKYDKLVNFRNQLVSEHDRVDADLTRYRNKTNTSVSYDLDRVEAIDDYLSQTFNDKSDFNSYANIVNFYKKFNKKLSHKDRINGLINDFLEKSKDWSADEWLNLYKEIIQMKDLPGIGTLDLFVGAKRGNTFGEIILTNNYDLPVMSINVANKTYKVIEPEDTDLEDIEENDIDSDSLPNETVEEKEEASETEAEDDLEETFEVSLDDAHDPKGKALVDTILGVKPDPVFVGKANKKTIDKLSVLNDAKNLYEVFEERTGKKVYGVGKSTGIRGEFYLLDENGNNIGIANVMTRDVRDINDNPMVNENIDRLLEELKNDPYNSDFNGNAESGYVESEDGRILGIYYESGKDSKHALSLGEVEMYFNPDMEVQKYIGLFESYGDYHGGQEPTISKLISQNIYS